jgi:Tfp pilus assembly protein PilF
MNSPSRTPYHYLTGVLVFVFAIAAYLPISQTDRSMLDEGALLYVAERLTKGDVLYRDIVTGIMPGVYYLQALVFTLLGYSVSASRAIAGATLAANALLLYFVSRRFLTKKTSLALGLFFTATALPSYWMAGYSQTSMTFVLLGLLFFLRYLGTRKTLFLVLSGAAAGVALLFKQNYGVFVTAGLGLILLARLATRKEWRQVLVFSAAFLAPLLLTVLYFYSRGALPAMAEYTFISLFKKAAGAYYKPYPLLSRTAPLFFRHELYNYVPFRDLAIWSLKEGYAREVWVRALVIVIYVLPPLVMAGSFLYGAASLIRRRLTWEEATLFLVSALLFLGVFPRSDIHHLVFVLPPLIITGALLCSKLPLRGGWLTAMRALALLVLGLFSVLCLVSSYMPVLHPAPGREKEALNVPRAMSIRVDRREATVIRAVTRHIREKTTPAEPVLVVPTGAMYYFLTARKSLVPYPLIMPGAMDETVVIEAMGKTGLRHIIYSDMSFDEETLSRHMPLIHEYITKNYHLDEDYPLRETGGDVYVLKRGPGHDDVTALDSDAKEALLGGRGAKMPVVLDLVKEFEKAQSGVILEDGRKVPLYRDNQVTRKAWLLKDAIQQEPGRGWSKVYTAFGLRVPRDAALRFSIGQSPVVWSSWFGDGALFEVFLYDKGRNKLERLFSRYLDPKNRPEERQWFTYLAGLKKYGGRDLIIFFVTSGGPRFNLTMGEMNRWRQIDMAGWGEPALVSLTEKPAPGAGVLAPEGPLDKDPMYQVPAPALRRMAGFEDITFILDEAKRAPGDYDVLLTLGRIYEKRGEKKKAIEEYRAALGALATGREARMRLALFAMRSGDLGRARELLEEGLKLRPWDSGLNMAMGGLLLRQKEYREAAWHYRKALAVRPENRAARIGLGRSYLRAGDARKARREAARVLETDPSNLGALMLLGDAYRLKKEWKRAEDSYVKALSIDPGSALARLRLAQSLRARGQSAEALRAFRKVLASESAPRDVKDFARREVSSVLGRKGEKRQ